MMILTIGYGNRSIEEFIDLLKSNQIEFLIDVRSQPYSRFNPDFSQKALKQTLLPHNIRYVFMGDSLGGRPDDPSCYTEDGRVDYDKYRNQKAYKVGIQRLINAYKGEHRVALMCSELKPEMCHRSRLIGESLHQLQIEVVHIDEVGQLKKHQDVITSFQLPLFDDIPTATSRKSYLAPQDDEQ